MAYFVLMIYYNKYSFLMVKRDETLDKIKCITDIVGELIKAYDKNEKINLSKLK